MLFADDDRDEVEEKRMWSKGDYARLSTSILAVDWLFEFSGSPINDCFVYLVAVLLALVDRFDVRKCELQSHITPDLSRSYNYGRYILSYCET